MLCILDIQEVFMEFIKGWAFGIEVKLLPGTPIYHIGLPGFKSQLCTQFQLSASVHPGSSR